MLINKTTLQNLFFVLLLGSQAALANPEQLQNVDGPNCLNAAMTQIGMSKNYRYASNAEMWTMLKSPLCRRLNNSEARQTNDIGIVLENGPYANKNIISHAFVQLAPDLFFEKHGYAKSESYQNVSLQQILEDYAFDGNPACKQNQFDRTACRVGTDFYRCGDLENYIKVNKSKIRSHTLSYFREMEKIELGLQDYLSAIGLPENKNKHLEIERNLQVLASKMQNIPESNAVEETFIYKVIANRFVSIAGQLNAVGHPELRDLIWQWENQDKNIEDIFEIILKMRIQDDLDLVYADVRKKYLSIYAPIVKEIRKVDLHVQSSEEYRENAGGVSLFKKDANIDMGYDMHRVKNMTPDAYMAILCHETGHLLGGKPYSENTKEPSAQWVSNVPSSSEGQSDYFSSLVCMKKVFALDTPDIKMHYDVSPKIQELCESTFSTIKEQNICQRSARAGLELMNYIASIYNNLNAGNTKIKVSLETPEKDGVSVGQLYPSPQCRLDTIVAGALNQKRPGCWYVEN